MHFDNTENALLKHCITVVYIIKCRKCTKCTLFINQTPNKMKKYQIIERKTKTGMERAVEELLAAGWHLVGGVSAYVDDQGKAVYLQAFARQG
jgi:hypothetical protein